MMKSGAIDYKSDIDTVAHELAHQWFGGLVTCRDWANIGLMKALQPIAKHCTGRVSKGLMNFATK